MRNFTVKGIVTALRTVAKDLADLRQIAQQARPAIASHHALRRAAQVQVDGVKARILHDPRSLGQRLRIRSEQLRPDGMLIVVERQIAPPLRLPHPRKPVRRSELRHQQPAPRLRIRDFRLDL